jgi:predicted ArsR family transcriptional regulator
MESRQKPKLAAVAVVEGTAGRVLSVCIRAPQPVRAIARAAGLSLASAYRQVGRLQAAGLVVVDRSALTPQGKRYELYRATVRSWSVSVTDAGVHVAWVDEIDQHPGRITLWPRAASDSLQTTEERPATGGSTRSMGAPTRLPHSVQEPS